MTGHREGMSTKLGRTLHNMVADWMREQDKVLEASLPTWKLSHTEGSSEPPPRTLNRAARRKAMAHTIGYPLRSGSKANARFFRRLAWRQGVILAMRKAQQEALSEKVK